MPKDYAGFKAWIDYIFPDKHGKYTAIESLWRGRLMRMEDSEFVTFVRAFRADENRTSYPKDGDIENEIKLRKDLLALERIDCPRCTDL